jgi:hypothetical protein
MIGTERSNKVWRNASFDPPLCDRSAQERRKKQIPVEGVEKSSVSMLTVQASGQ